MGFTSIWRKTTKEETTIIAPAMRCVEGPCRRDEAADEFCLSTQSNFGCVSSLSRLALWNPSVKPNGT